MKRLYLLLLIVFLLSSCTPAVTPTLTPTQILTPLPTATQTPSPTPTITPTATPIGGGQGRLIFDLQKTDFAKLFPDLKGDLNIFTSNVDGTDLIPVTNGLRGYNYLQSVSPDGTKVLIASASDLQFQRDRHATLYSIDLNSLDSEPVQLATGITEHAAISPYMRQKESIAKWIDNTRLVYIGDGDKGYGIYIVNWDGSDQLNIYSNVNGGAKPAAILGIDKSRVYWFSETSTRLTSNSSTVTDLPWWSSLDGSEQGSLDYQGKQIIFNVYFNNMVFSPDGTQVAWMEPATRTFHHNYLHIAFVSKMDEASAIDILSSYPSLIWRPDGTQLLVRDTDETFGPQDHSNDLFGLYTVTGSPPWTIKNAHKADVLNLLIGGAWVGDFSPDGRQILVFQQQGTTAWAKIILLNMDTMTLSNALTGHTPHDVQWLP